MSLLFIRFVLLIGFGFCMPGLALAQLPVKGHFTSATPEQGWATEQAGYLTGGRYDPDQAGWLWLTDAMDNGTSTAINTSSFSADKGLELRFEFAVWGGGLNGGDGLTAFLFDATQDMGGALRAQGLGYCKGAGGWLALGLDALGLFSAPSDACAGGPGVRPQSVVVRGPASQGNPYVGGTVLGEALGQHMATTRPAPQLVRLTLRPKTQGIGFWVDLTLVRQAPKVETQVFKDLDFPYPAPAQLRLGFTASTKVGKNVHEVRNVALDRLPPDTAVALSLVFDPPQVKREQTSELLFTLGAKGGSAFSFTEDARLPIDKRLTVAEPLTLSGSCMGTVLFDAASHSLILKQGNVVGAMGCTVGIMVRASEAGLIQASVPALVLTTSTQASNRAASGTLVVTD